MNQMKTLTVAIAITLMICGCADSAEPARPAPAPASQSASPTQSPAPSFINRVWRVSESSAVAAGTLYVFLSEGTLVITSENSKPALGTWKRDGSGLTMVEESIPYKVDILNLSAGEFRIRSNNPGRAVEIRLVPAA
jgi:hypothetical protein